MTIETMMNGSKAVFKISGMLDTETAPELEALLDSGLAKGGMIPNLTNIINLIENGVKEVAVLNGRVRYNIISEFIGAKTVGTVVTRD